MGTGLSECFACKADDDGDLPLVPLIIESWIGLLRKADMDFMGGIVGGIAGGMVVSSFIPMVGSLRNESAVSQA